MSFLHTTARIASSIRKLSLSKRILLCPLLPRNNGSSQCIRQTRHAHGLPNNTFSMRNRQSVYRRKDNLGDNYELIYFHPEETSWGIFLFCSYLSNIVILCALTYFCLTFEPSDENEKVSIYSDRRLPRVKSKLELFLPVMITVGMISLTAMFLRQTAVRMYVNRRNLEYLVIYLADLGKTRKITIPYNCFKPKFPVPILAGRETIFTVNGHTVVLFEENFMSPYLGRQVLTNCME